MNIKKIKRAFVRFFYVEYCLRVTKTGKEAQSIYCLKKCTLMDKINKLNYGDYWTLYKSGPFHMPER